MRPWRGQLNSFNVESVNQNYPIQLETSNKGVECTYHGIPIAECTNMHFYIVFLIFLIGLIRISNKSVSVYFLGYVVFFGNKVYHVSLYFFMNSSHFPIYYVRNKILRRYVILMRGRTVHVVSSINLTNE